MVRVSSGFSGYIYNYHHYFYSHCEKQMACIAHISFTYILEMQDQNGTSLF